MFYLVWKAYFMILVNTMTPICSNDYDVKIKTFYWFDLNYAMSAFIRTPLATVQNSYLINSIYFLMKISINLYITWKRDRLLSPPLHIGVYVPTECVFNQKAYHYLPTRFLRHIQFRKIGSGLDRMARGRWMCSICGQIINHPIIPNNKRKIEVNELI